MAKLTFEVDRCKGCGLCVLACPKQILAIAKDRLNAKGHSPVTVVAAARCTGCAACATMCPDCVITVER